MIRIGFDREFMIAFVAHYAAKQYNDNGIDIDQIGKQCTQVIEDAYEIADKIWVANKGILES